MKISLTPGIKTVIAVAAAGSALFLGASKAIASKNVQKDPIYDEFIKNREDEFEKQVIENQNTTLAQAAKSKKITPQGTTDISVLSSAPSPKIKIAGQNKTASFVVDLSKNVLYTYDETGNATAAYLIASGKKNTPTQKGVRVVSHVETYPYRSAPAATRRRNHPRDYGPKIIILEKLDPETGGKSSTGQFIHGNGNPGSIGKYVSLGCMRMDNEVIKKLAANAKRGDIVIIK